MQSSRDLVRALFASRPVSRPPFIPLMATAAARFMQVPVRQMFSDPTVMANTLDACRKLFKYDGVVVLFDSTLEAEALGCRVSWPEGGASEVVAPIVSTAEELERLDASGIERRGRIPAALEAAKRLALTAGREAALLGVVTGPVTLGRHLMGDAVAGALERVVELGAKTAVSLARAYGELKLDAVILAEDDLGPLGAADYPLLRPALSTLRNVVNFYDAPLIIHARRVPAERLPDLFRLEADGFSVGGILPGPAASPPRGKLRGGCLPTSALTDSPEAVERATREMLDSFGRDGLFVTSEWEVPQATPALNLHKVVQVLNSAAK